ncbi:hypothetical protein OPT61_g6358 [Boeremia exigua]|uniref:Uncharacterized protein n=1 Tax=Boeremia exigua TaxID=749465 RepID=A0ACC2I6X5_9PLEO|nr:hypothetical protein OPT61_g6358 [Boeremia exigua]
MEFRYHTSTIFADKASIDPDQDISICLWWEGERYREDGTITWGLQDATRRWNWRTMRREARSDLEIRAENPSFENVIDMSLKWAVTCRTMHDRCRSELVDDKTKFIPSRLLDVGIVGQQSIRLVKSEVLAQNTHLTYCTLSYCWGDKRNAVCTTRENFTEHLNAIAIDSLPLTIRDAIIVTRAFGVQHLWIDALCIIQVENGENEDWQREVPNMGRIYSHSIFTIAASSAENSSIGLFSRTESARWPVLDYRLTPETCSAKNQNVFTMTAALPEWTESVESSVLSTRGWVLQERMRASRTLFFTKEGVFWQCNELLNSEYGQISKYSVYFRLPTTEQICTSILDRTDDFLPHDPWIKLLSAYVGKHFTNPTDRLPAITGLGTDIARACGVEFYMGVLTHSLTMHKTTRDPFMVLGIPSQAVTFLDSMQLGVKIDKKTDIELVLDKHRLRARARLQSLRITRTSAWCAGSYGCGPQRLSNHGYEFMPTQCRADLSASRATGGSRTAILVFDTLLDALPKEGGSILCIRWYAQLGTIILEPGPWTISKKVSSMAMVISPVDGSDVMFTRRGWMVTESDDLFQDEPKNIMLV